MFSSLLYLRGTIKFIFSIRGITMSESRQVRRANARNEVKVQKQFDAMSSAAWDDVNRIHLECHGLSLLPIQALPLMRDPIKVERIKDKSELERCSTVLNKDVLSYKERLNAIHSKHAGKTGDALNTDELMECISIGEEYQEWLTSYQLVVLPVLNTILAMFEESDKDE